jgi:hypothetical protein
VEIQLIDLFNRQATGITEWKKKNTLVVATRGWFVVLWKLSSKLQGWVGDCGFVV